MLEPLPPLPLLVPPAATPPFVPPVGRLPPPPFPPTPPGDTGVGVGVGDGDGVGAGLSGDGEGRVGFFGGLGLGFAFGWGRVVRPGAGAATGVSEDGVLFEASTGLATTGADCVGPVAAGVER